MASNDEEITISVTEPLSLEETEDEKGKITRFFPISIAVATSFLPAMSLPSWYLTFCNVTALKR